MKATAFFLSFSFICSLTAMDQKVAWILQGDPVHPLAINQSQKKDFLTAFKEKINSVGLTLEDALEKPEHENASLESFELAFWGTRHFLEVATKDFKQTAQTNALENYWYHILSIIKMTTNTELKIALCKLAAAKIQKVPHPISVHIGIGQCIQESLDGSLD